MSDLKDRYASNVGVDDRFTCPACYEDLPEKRPGSATCKCGAELVLRRETTPVAVAYVKGHEPDADFDEDGEIDF